MAKTLLIAFLFVYTATFGQVNDFSIANGQVTWNEEYRTSLSFKDFSRLVNESGLFDKITTTDSTFTGRTINMQIDHKNAGYSIMRAPTYLGGNGARAFAVIRYMGDKYTVTLKTISIVEGSTISAGLFSTTAGEEKPIEYWATNKTKEQFTKTFAKDGSKILDYTFSQRFRFQELPAVGAVK